MAQRNFTILSKTITTAVTIVAVDHGNIPIDINGITAQAIFTYGSGGTTVKAFLQTTIDDGTTWFDIMSFAFATTTATKVANVTAKTPVITAVPVDGALTDNTILDGFVGTKLRAKYVTLGTYAASTTLKINVRLHT